MYFTGGVCSIILDSSSICYPGQTVSGRVECNFSSESKVRGIGVQLKGKAKVHWEEGRNNSYYADETYYDMEYDLLTGETVIPPGKYTYPFTFNLPSDIPPSLTEDDGKIKHSVRAMVDRPWALNYEAKEILSVHSLIDLNCVDDIKDPEEITKTKKPFALFGDAGPIIFTVRLPLTGYAPNRTIVFTATVNNESKINVEKMRFRLVQVISHKSCVQLKKPQGFSYYTKCKSKTVTKVKGRALTVVNSLIKPGREQSWDLELQVPPTMFNENLYFCKLIKSFVELRGKLLLPLPHANLKIAIPLLLGSIPLQIPAKELN